MSREYYENPLIFVNSSDRSNPRGRNIRAQHRGQNVAPAQQGQDGSYSVIDFGFGSSSVGPPGQSGSTRQRKRRKRSDGSSDTSSRSSGGSSSSSDDGDASLGGRPDRPLRVHHPLRTSLGDEAALTLTSINPSRILALAAFHVRRTASMFMRSSPSRLQEVLRCRQWSSVVVFPGPEELGKVPYLDGAVFCVAAKLREITFGKISPVFVLYQYDKALTRLREELEAEEAPGGADESKLLTAMQLLAIYEMLDGFETGGNDNNNSSSNWSKHINGAQSMMRMRLQRLAHSSRSASSHDDDDDDDNGRSMQQQQQQPFSAQIAPLFTDALLLDNQRDFFSACLWQQPLRTALAERHSGCRNHSIEGLIGSFTELPELLARAAAAAAASTGVADFQTKLRILCRAQMIRSEIRASLLGCEGGVRPETTTGGGAVDVLGLSLAAMVTLDRIITGAMPRGKDYGVSIEEQTSRLCVQILEHELDISELEIEETDKRGWRRDEGGGRRGAVAAERERFFV